VKLTPNTAVGPQISLKFEYDWQSRRIRKQVWPNTNWSGTPTNDVKFLYDGWNLLTELNATNNALIRSFVWGSDLSGTIQGAGGVGGLLFIGNGASAIGYSAAAFDGNGNVMALVSLSGGTNCATYEYSPFGELLRATGPMAKANPFRFSTKYQDDETDLLYYGYRYYNASTGRWLSTDPLQESGGRNLYGFTHNDPVQRVDVDGRAAVIVIAGVTVTVADCAIIATTICLAIPPCRDALIQLVKQGVRAIGDCVKCSPKREKEYCPLEDQHYMGKDLGYRCEYWCRKSGARPVVWVPDSEGGCPKYVLQ